MQSTFYFHIFSSHSIQLLTLGCFSDERDRSPLTFNDIVYSHLGIYEQIYVLEIFCWRTLCYLKLTNSNLPSSDSDVVKVIFNETAVINDPEELCVDAFRTEVEKNHNSVGWLFDGNHLIFLLFLLRFLANSDLCRC